MARRRRTSRRTRPTRTCRNKMMEDLLFGYSSVGALLLALARGRCVEPSPMEVQLQLACPSLAAAMPMWRVLRLRAAMPRRNVIWRRGAWGIMAPGHYSCTVCPVAYELQCVSCATACASLPNVSTGTSPRVTGGAQRYRTENTNRSVQSEFSRVYRVQYSFPLPKPKLLPAREWGWMLPV